MGHRYFKYRKFSLAAAHQQKRKCVYEISLWLSSRGKIRLFFRISKEVICCLPAEILFFQTLKFMMFVTGLYLQNYFYLSVSNIFFLGGGVGGKRVREWVWVFVWQLLILQSPGRQGSLCICGWINWSKKILYLASDLKKKKRKLKTLVPSILFFDLHYTGLCQACI